MRIAALFLCLFVGQNLVAPTAFSQTPQASVPPGPPGEITSVFRDWFAAVEAGDPDGILALVDADFVIKWPMGAPLSDREQLRAALAKMQQAFGQTVQWE